MMSVPVSVGLISLLIGMMIQVGAFAFFMGRLSQRVGALEKGADGDRDLNKTVVELTVKMTHVEAMIEKLSVAIEGVQRQLGNLSMGRMGRGVEFPAE